MIQSRTGIPAIAADALARLTTSEGIPDKCKVVVENGFMVRLIIDELHA